MPTANPHACKNTQGFGTRFVLGLCIGATRLGNMFQFKRDFESYYCGARSPEFARSLNPELQNFETWLSRNKSRIPLEETAAKA